MENYSTFISKKHKKVIEWIIYILMEITMKKIIYTFTHDQEGFFEFS